MRLWVLLVAEGAEGMDGWGREVIHNYAFFYTDNRLVTSTDHEWLQGALNTLTELFIRVGLHTNVRKTSRIICHPFCMVDTQLE